MWLVQTEQTRPAARSLLDHAADIRANVLSTLLRRAQSECRALPQTPRPPRTRADVNRRRSNGSNRRSTATSTENVSRAFNADGYPPRSIDRVRILGACLRRT